MSRFAYTALYENEDGERRVFSVGGHETTPETHTTGTPYLCEVKDVFIGRERQAIQVFPPRSKHINIHSHCLHLWSALEDDGDGLPDFGAAGTI